ncbi:MAG: ubiquinone/menaquinone biosynthesis C-methylase UbiE [Candidatus Poriferisodalaceae bacterium]|jgi:ubiquinone/menaquinone biosynthesis C-methylase UbiE
MGVAVTSAFDGLAAGYDDVAESSLGSTLRARVHGVLEEVVEPGQSVLDLGCGTGLDLLYLSQLGLEASGADASQEMLDVARRRLASAGAPPPDLALLDLNDIEARAAVSLGQQSFDHILANFGVVNCVRDLGGLLTWISTLLAPGGTFTMAIMGPWCPWEMGRAVFRLDRHGVTRRRSANNYHSATVSYPSWSILSEAMPDSLRVERREALGWILPTFEQRALVESRPKLLSLLAMGDRLGARFVSRLGLGDHWIIVCRKRTA